MISVVTPFYNEAQILEKSLMLLLGSLEKLDGDWEVIMVDDGSTDGSPEIARQFVKRHQDRVRLVSYPENQGRGYALWQGINASRGEIIVTEEIDCSWGPDIVSRLADYLRPIPRWTSWWPPRICRGAGTKTFPSNGFS